MFDDDYSGENQKPRIIPAIIIAFITTIIIAGVVIPMTVGMTYETVSNSEPSGIYMDYVDSGDIEKNYTLKIENNKLKVTGSYTATVDATDQIVILTDNLCIYVHDGALRIFRNNADSLLPSGTTVTVGAGKVYGTSYEWAYVPVAHGEYSSFTTLDFVTSEKVGIRVGANPGIVDNWQTYEVNEKDVIGIVALKN